MSTDLLSDPRAPQVSPEHAGHQSRQPAEPQADPHAHAGATHRTVIPDVDGIVPAKRRVLRRVTLDDTCAIVGSLAAASALSTLLFGWFAPLSGAIGWVVVTYLAFLALYSVVISLTGSRESVTDKLITALLYSSGLALFAALSFVVVYTLVRGREALFFHPNFFTQTMELAGPLDPLDVGGILHAIVGTLIQISIALAITVPLGIVTAVFLNEFPGRFARFVRTVSDAMTALPSIVAGLFIYAAVILLFTHQRSGFAAALAISVMMLPIVIRASDVVLRLVAGNLREASYALGAPRWRTVWHVVLPTARSGLVNAVILGTARGIGETSPVLLTSGVTAVLSLNPFSGPMISLPLQVFELVKSPEPNMIARGFGTAAVLILLVLVLFTLARAFGGRGPGQLSERQQRAAAQASLKDVRRFLGRAAASVDSRPAAASAASAASAAASAPEETPR
ncbi:phosphate ABC transporter permease PstA [Leifsonia kafniensis]|uniref:Phosphate transport system permease protein PstA n=1 Tax=Leifsonia kafniensis TaxID=475957 RepID=A0ABP7KPG6_9MICO